MADIGDLIASMVKLVAARREIAIPRNTLLAGPEPTLELDMLRSLKQVVAAAAPAAPDEALVKNLALVSDETLDAVHARYGEAGVWALMFLASGHQEREFKWFYEIIRDGLMWFPGSDPSRMSALSTHNAELPEGPEAAKFSLNFLQPSLSRKLYHPGRHPGYLVYGIGGPKILVSHPFLGAELGGELYDAYKNSVDIVTSLMMRSYWGRFLFFDSLPGLNVTVHGQPAWLVWFAIMAAHSDLVLFVKYGDDLSPWQRREAALTPDRVHKTIVAIPHGELRWATTQGIDPGTKILYVTGEPGGDTQESFHAHERKHAMALVDSYANAGVPQDVLIRCDEGGEWESFPADLPVYAE